MRIAAMLACLGAAIWVFNRVTRWLPTNGAGQPNIGPIKDTSRFRGREYDE